MSLAAITGPEARLNRKIEQLEYEFAGTLSEILAGFAQDGESVTATARVLDISPQVVRRMAEEFGILKDFPPPTQGKARREAAKERRGKPVPEASERQRKVMLKQHGFWHDGHYDTLLRHCDRLGMSYSTVRARVKSGMSKSQALSLPAGSSPAERKWRGKPGLSDIVERARKSALRIAASRPMENRRA